MALVHEHDKLRAQPPRAKNLGRLTAGQPNRGRGAGGRFAVGNKEATERTVKAAIKRQLGRDATTPEVESLYRETMIQFRAELRRMPSQAAHVQRELAARARWSVLSARYATRAAELGLDSEEGQKALELALKLDSRAERLGVTALDIAERLHRSEPKPNPLAWLTAPAPAAPSLPVADKDTSRAEPPAECQLDASVDIVAALESGGEKP